MIDASAVAEIVATYQKHGWILRRVLLSPATEKKLEDKESFFGDAAIIESEIDAAWFSRPPLKGGVAWELRYLCETPFALLAKIDENDPELENQLLGIELNLRESVARKETA